jgi:hypothetical protein
MTQIPHSSAAWREKPGARTAVVLRGPHRKCPLCLAASWRTTHCNRGACAAVSLTPVGPCCVGQFSILRRSRVPRLGTLGWGTRICGRRLLELFVPVAVNEAKHSGCKCHTDVGSSALHGHSGIRSWFEKKMPVAKSLFVADRGKTLTETPVHLGRGVSANGPGVCLHVSSFRPFFSHQHTPKSPSVEYT